MTIFITSDFYEILDSIFYTDREVDYEYGFSHEAYVEIFQFKHG